MIHKTEIHVRFMQGRLSNDSAEPRFVLCSTTLTFSEMSGFDNSLVYFQLVHAESAMFTADVFATWNKSGDVLNCSLTLNG